MFGGSFAQFMAFACNRRRARQLTCVHADRGVSSPRSCRKTSAPWPPKGLPLLINRLAESRRASSALYDLYLTQRLIRFEICLNRPNMRVHRSKCSVASALADRLENCAVVPSVSLSTIWRLEIVRAHQLPEAALHALTESLQN